MWRAARVLRASVAVTSSGAAGAGRLVQYRRRAFVRARAAFMTPIAPASPASRISGWVALIALDRVARTFNRQKRKGLAGQLGQVLKSVEILARRGRFRAARRRFEGGSRKPAHKGKSPKNRTDLGASLQLWWPGTESNHRHADFQSAALPTELPGHEERKYIKGVFHAQALLGNFPKFVEGLPSDRHTTLMPRFCSCPDRRQAA